MNYEAGVWFSADFVTAPVSHQIFGFKRVRAELENLDFKRRNADCFAGLPLITV